MSPLWWVFAYPIFELKQRNVGNSLFFWRFNYAFVGFHVSLPCTTHILGEFPAALRCAAPNWGVRVSKSRFFPGIFAIRDILCTLNRDSICRL